MMSYHKKARKRELQKNKEQRLAARDAKVRETKTVDSVKDEIRKLERQYKNKEARPHAIQTKLDRLNKELKLVQQQKEQDQKSNGASNHSASQSLHSKRAPAWKPLENPELSVYFDAVMNPYGVPPPGKPHLYRTPNGGTTLNLQEAGLPGRAPPQPPPPPPPPRSTQIDHNPQNRNHAQGQEKQYRNEHYGQQNKSQTPQDSQRSSPPRRVIPTNTTKKPNDASSGLAAERPKRYGKQKLGDIWASNEDEEAIPEKSTASRPLKDETWHYQDQSGQVQGPFTTSQMEQWISAGFFPPHQFVQAASTGTWNPLRSTPGLKGFLKNNDDSKPPARQAESVQDRISALREDTISSHNRPNAQDDDEKHEPSVQDRIAALRQAHVEEESTKLSESEPSVQDRIAALRQAHVEEESTKLSGSEPSVQDRIAALRQAHVEEESTKLSESEPSVQDRIAALRQAHVEEESTKLSESEPSVQDRIAALRQAHAEEESTKVSESEPSVQDRIAALRQAHVEEESTKLSESEPSVQDRIAALRQGHVEEESTKLSVVEQAEIPYHVDDMPPYAVGEMAEIPYPVQEGEMADVPYPVHDDNDASYDASSIPYPVYGVYDDDGGGEDRVDGAAEAPVVDSYPVMDSDPADEAPQGKIPEEASQTKKRGTIDPGVLSMLPSHVQKRRKG